MTEIKKITPKSRRNKTSLADVVPDIEKYWDYEKNHGTVPSDYARSSSEKVWTFCPVCGESVHVLHGLLMKMVLGRLIIAEPAGNGIPRLGKNPIY